MVKEDIRISFVCQNLHEQYRRGKLALPEGFSSYQAERLPELVELHVDDFKTWHGRISKNRLFIEGLESLMDYYLVKPYHFVILHYDGYKKFKMNIFNPYGIEIDYPVEHKINHYASLCTDLEVQRLAVDYKHNIVDNSVLCSSLILEGKHLKGDESVVMLSRVACHRLGISDTLQEIRILYGQRVWHVDLKWKDGSARFGKSWATFIRDSGLLEGDILGFYKSDADFSINVCQFKMKQKEEVRNDDNVGRPSALRFIKCITEGVLRTGEFVVPFLFSATHYRTLGDSVRIVLGGGEHTTFYYSCVESKFHGLHSFFKKYHVEKDYLLSFCYLGFSALSITIYDRETMDHLRDLDGYLRLEDFDSKFCTIKNLVGVDDRLQESEAANMITDADEMEIISLSNTSVESDVDGEESGHVNDRIQFVVILRRSHVNQRCHGAYLDKTMSSVTQDWNRRTTVTFHYRGRTWSVEVLKGERNCRFGIGWDKFIITNGFKKDEELVFQFLGNFRFNVMVGGR